jgi:hypothetical protein
MFDPDVVTGVQHARHPSRETVQFHADEAHAGRGQGNEGADAAARLPARSPRRVHPSAGAPRAWPG